jgi:anthranilate synthase component 1
LKEILGCYRYVPDPALPRFDGGAIGYLGYAAVRLVERIPKHAKEDLPFPDAGFLIVPSFVLFDHVAHRMIVVANAHVERDPARAYRRARAEVRRILARLSRPIPAARLRARAGAPRRGNGRADGLVSNFSRRAFCDAVRRTKRYIREGDIIQAVISQRFALPYACRELSIYRALRSINPSPYMFFLDFGDHVVTGASPEVMVRLEDKRIVLRPIAGTRPRGASPEEDERLARELLADPKECAEHVMLVDLGRNDVGRVAKPGSVHVSDFMVIERYSHVMHIVSEVEGTLAKGKDAFDVVRACFPAGTVTGAPKVRAMEIIADLEETERGPYAGAVGYFSYSGNLDTCITIRSVFLKDGKAYFQSGAGIVADSVPEREYVETVNKAAAIRRAIRTAEEGRYDARRG